MNQCLSLDQNSTWKARLQCDFHRASTGKTELARLAHEGPLRVQKLFHDEDLAHCYLLHPPGGMVSGDDLACRFRVHPKAHVLLTTPASGKLYRSRANGSLQTADAQLSVDPGAFCAYLPQDTIIFDRAHGSLNTQVSIAANATFLGWEHLVFGRFAGNHPFTQGQISQSLTIHRQSQLLYRDHLQITPRVLHEISGLSAMTSFASLILVLPDTFDTTEALLADCRDGLRDFSGISGATAIRPHLVSIRLLSDRAETTRMALESLWLIIAQHLLNRSVQLPRIWRT